jgi:two-component system CheB/CheR fusion protein
MAMSSIKSNDLDRYLALLQSDAGERDQLAKDLLIHVTFFFRDPDVFEYLGKKIIPDLISNHAEGKPVRIWVAGCSTGEEAYSLAMLFREGLDAAGRHIELQLFASDADPDALATAREGVYPDTIEAQVSPARLARFFMREGNGYRISPDLRASVVFAAHDVLTDPPFSRIDFVSCRNLLIYLTPEAQARVISLFHFALRSGGTLLLGSAETAGNIDARFEIISKSERLYRQIGGSRPGEISFSLDPVKSAGRPALSEHGSGSSHRTVLADICRRLVLENHAPAALLVNREHECLFSIGPTDRFLHVASGHPTHDLLAMASPDLRSKLRSAIQTANQEDRRIVVAGGRTRLDGFVSPFNIDVQPVQCEGEELLLICFVDKIERVEERKGPAKPVDATRIAELEQELESTKVELHGAIHDLEISGEEQKIINEDVLSVNEEYQSTNEELLTSKEELQSLNEELTALNGQLQETLELQRITSNDLQNVLFSTDVATLFLDTDLKIRFFTPSTKSLFNLIPGDVGRPLSDLRSAAADDALAGDAETVLRSLTPIEREIETPDGSWFVRRILPYRTQGSGPEGVVITFIDITERKHTAQALEAAKQQADLANIAKSRFLAAASHDLRQPLQSLVLLQGLLADLVEGEAAKKLVARLDQTLAAAVGMLNTMLDINQIEAGVAKVRPTSFPIDGLLRRLQDEFADLAQAQGLELRMVACSLMIRSDPRLLERMIRNLVANALNYTSHGRLLLGCRRRGGTVRIEVWDTGIGIAEENLEAIFDEFHQIDDVPRERSRGLGLGLAIVRQLGHLAGHEVGVRSRLGQGSVFSIDVPLAATGDENRRTNEGYAAGERARRRGEILVVEDDPAVRELLELILASGGHRVRTAADGASALKLISAGEISPDLVLADYNLPNGLDGLQLTRILRDRVSRQLPVIILTGDISTNTLRDIAQSNCVLLDKPVKSDALMDAIERLLPIASLTAPIKPESESAIAPVIYIVDDDKQTRDAICDVLESDGRTVEAYPDSEAFLEHYRPFCKAGLLIDAYLPGMSGVALLQHLKEGHHHLPAIMITGSSDVAMAVQAMRAGALDFIEKPIGRAELLASVARMFDQSQDSSESSSWQESAAKRLAGLTSRQREIMKLVLDGHPSKNIAADLHISQRTVENHRAAIMKKSGSRSLPELARLAFAVPGDLFAYQAAAERLSVPRASSSDD